MLLHRREGGAWAKRETSWGDRVSGGIGHGRCAVWIRFEPFQTGDSGTPQRSPARSRARTSPVGARTPPSQDSRGTAPEGASTAVPCCRWPPSSDSSPAWSWRSDACRCDGSKRAGWPHRRDPQKEEELAAAGAEPREALWAGTYAIALFKHQGAGIGNHSKYGGKKRDEEKTPPQLKVLPTSRSSPLLGALRCK